MTPIPRKADAELFTSHLDRLSRAVTLGESRVWWPRYIYHFTDITNAVSILDHGAILSRTSAIAEGLMENDNASQDVIQNTTDETKKYARFYFRPRTPTQYRNEGFRPPAQQELHSHCPVPVYFLLNAKEVLTRRDAEFTDGNAKRGCRFTSGDDFVNIPFDKIFHDSSLFHYNEFDKARIIYHRHAEVLVPDRLLLTPEVLDWVWCRTPAEHRTLLTLLRPETRKRWEGRIGQGTKTNLFFGTWTYVETASLGRSELSIHFNRSSLSEGDFSVRIELDELSTNRRYEWKKTCDARESIRLSLSTLRAPDAYRVRCYLDDHIAYCDEFVNDDEVPF